MTITKEMLFRKKGFIQFLNSKQKELDQLLENIQPKVGTVIQKYQTAMPLDQGHIEYKLYILRVIDFIKKIYQKMEDEEWQRVSEERSSELKSTLQKCISRDPILDNEYRIEEIQNRYLVLTGLELKNWHLFPELSIELKSPMLCDEKTTLTSIDSTSGVNQPNSNLIIFVGKNSEGKSAIFNAIRMGFLGPEQYFTGGTSAQKDEQILELVSKKAIEEARNKKQDHIIMEISLFFKIRKQESDNWDAYAIKRIWKIKVDPQSDQKNSIYQFETQTFRLNQMGDGNHRPLDKETFEMIIERYIPKPLQNLFIVNKSILTKPIIQQRSNFIQDIALSSSDYYTLDKLSDIIAKLKEYIESEERQWVLKNVKSDKEKLQELDKLIKQKNKEIQNLKNKEVTFKKQKIQLNEELGKIREQTKDYKEEEVDKYVQLEEEINNLKKELQEKNDQLNKAINQTYLQSRFASLVDFNDIKKKLSIITTKLPEKPVFNEFVKFSDYMKIIQLILKNDKCICDSPISKETRERFEYQLRKDTIEMQYQLVEELTRNIPNGETEFSSQIAAIQKNQEEIIKIDRKLAPLSEQMKKLKPKTFIKEIQEKLKSIEKIENDINAIEKKINQNEEEISLLEHQHDDYEKEYEELKEKVQEDSLKNLQNNFIELRMYTELSQVILKESQKMYERELQEYIQNLITHYFKDIDWEGKFWKGFQIDENWKIQFISQENQSVTLPSDGQSKIIMFSLICSLIELHRFKIPWIMDNVLSEISDLNIKGFASQVISNKEFPQQIFFFSKTEWQDIKKFIEKNIYQCFTFKKTSANISQIIPITNIEDIIIEI